MRGVTLRGMGDVCEGIVRERVCVRGTTVREMGDVCEGTVRGRVSVRGTTLREIGDARELCVEWGSEKNHSDSVLHNISLF